MKEFLKPIGINMGEFLGRITSRRFLGTIAAVMLPILNRTQEWGMTEIEVGMIVTAIITYVVADTVEQVKLNTIKAEQNG